MMGAMGSTGYPQSADRLSGRNAQNSDNDAVFPKYVQSTFLPMILTNALRTMYSAAASFFTRSSRTLRLYFSKYRLS